MNPRTLSMLVVSALLILTCSVLVPSADAAADQTYRGQLDANAAGLFDELSATFGSAESVETLEIKYVFKDPVLFGEENEARAYALETVRAALAAYYLTDPSPIWLWNLPASPVDEADVTRTVIPVTITYDGIKVYQAPYTVTFTLSVPEKYKADPAKAVSEVKEKMQTFEGTVREKATGINDILRNVKSATDKDGEVGNIHDALVSGSSSSAGVAAAFTVLAKASGLEAFTVAGQVMTGDGSATETGYWNVVKDEDGWYAVDSTRNGSSWRNCLLAGVTTQIDLAGQQERFGATHTADVFFLGARLNAPQISSSGYDWPDDRSLVDKYGTYVFGAVIAVIIVATLLHAVRRGDI